ncbi:hypothetical protein BT96DRAFT_1010625 [Gymnopus androsaceus JB14]|uniref:Uncharacterized protein n=1 Tax=Gymnopus androsaceus JB14 TaxID=1447944 RepID=A0A6A4GAE2_9AGAR|nr:hypothetical protein BT96DRAFT_1010625 [Gymnopus androsaceus JB14]
MHIYRMTTNHTQSASIAKPNIQVAKVPRFSCLGFRAQPEGLWQAFPQLLKDATFAYSSDQNQLQTFALNVIDMGGSMLTVPTGPCSVVYLFEQVRWKGNVWIGEDSQSIIFTFHGLQDDDGVYYLGWVKLEPESMNGFPVTLPSKLCPKHP